MKIFEVCLDISEKGLLFHLQDDVCEFRLELSGYCCPLSDIFAHNPHLLPLPIYFLSVNREMGLHCDST